MKIAPDQTRCRGIGFHHRAGLLRSTAWLMLLLTFGFQSAMIVGQTPVPDSDKADVNAQPAAPSWQLDPANGDDARPETITPVLAEPSADKQPSVIEEPSGTEQDLLKQGESEAEDTLLTDQLQPLDRSESDRISTVPLIDLPPGLRESLQNQFEYIQEIEEEEDAFSDNLGEAYFAYGKMLTQAGRLDEARNMYAKTLHLSRINNGVYAIEQRPILRAMFDLHEAQNQLADMESSLKQIMWLEKKNPGIHDAYGYDLFVRLGNAFIDLFYSRRKISELSLETINKGIFYLNHAVKRYGKLPLDEAVMPYGELALLQYIKKGINNELGRAFYDQSRLTSVQELDKKPRIQSPSNFLGNATRNLRAYLKKAKEESNLEHEVRALRDLGDLFLLFDRTRGAADFYQQAWLAAQGLDANHPLVLAFEQPIKLPAFNYASNRRDVDGQYEVAIVPLNFSLDRFGRIQKMHTASGTGPYPTLVKRAERASKRHVFRPTIEYGKMIATDQVFYDMKVALRYGETLTKLKEAQ